MTIEADVRAIPNFANYPKNIIDWIEEIARSLSPSCVLPEDKDQDVLMIALCLLCKLDLQVAQTTSTYAQILDGSAPASAAFGNFNASSREFWTGGTGGVYGTIHLEIQKRGMIKNNPSAFLGMSLL